MRRVTASPNMPLPTTCLRCDAPLDVKAEQGEARSAVVLTSPGNYGSAVFDGPGILVAAICDSCLRAAPQTAYRHALISRDRPSYTPTEWIPDSDVPEAP